MSRKAITLQQMEEALRDFARWMQNKLAGYMTEPSAEGKSGWVLTTNGAGGRSWEYMPGFGEVSDGSVTTAALAEGSVTEGKLAGGSVSSAKLADGAVTADKLAGGAVTEAKLADGAVTADKLAADAVIAGRLRFENVVVTAASFAADSTYEDFPYRAAVTLEGALASMVPEVTLSVADAVSGVFAPVAECYDGGVYIYASEAPGADITIPTVVLWR